MEVTSAIVPFSRTSTRGLSHLQAWQNLKRVSNCVRNTMNFGSLLKLVSLKKTLKITIYFNYFSDSLWLIGCQLLSHNILSVISLCVHILIFMFQLIFSGMFPMHYIYTCYQGCALTFYVVDMPHPLSQSLLIRPVFLHHSNHLHGSHLMEVFQSLSCNAHHRLQYHHL